MPTGTAGKPQPPRVIIYFLKVFLPLCVVLAGMVLILVVFQRGEYLRDLKNKQIDTVNLEREVLETDLLAHIDDAVFLADLAALALANPNAKLPVHGLLEQAFYYFSREQKVYDQVRFLDASGQERVRINRSGHRSQAVAPRELQHKKDRYYFRESMALDPGQVYISPFDLNIEHGQIERPFKPTLRFASPVKVPGQGAKGVVVLNFLGERLLQRLHRAARAANCAMYLVNRQGWWLVGPSPEQEWGFMLPGCGHHNMGNTFPAVWEAMATEGDGQKTTPHGLFTFQTIKLVNQKGPEVARLPEGRMDDFWWVVSRVPPPRLSPPWLKDYGWMALGALVLLAVLAGLVWLWAMARVRRIQAEQDSLLQQKRLQAISDTAVDAVTLIDSQDRVQFWNRAAERLFGYSRSEAMGRELHRLVSGPEARIQAQRGLDHFARTGKGPVLDQPRELLARRKDGASFPAEIAVSSFQVDGQWYAAGNVRDITQRKHHERELKRLANTDPLTGAYNRRRFLELAEQEAARTQRYGGPLAMLMLDLDHFKRVNDTYGHDAGDLVLQSLVRVCRQVLREVDIFGRIGGEEFMALLPETDLKGARKVAERLRAAVAAEPVAVDGAKISYTTSVGVAALRTDMDLEMLMKAVDTALYQAKEAGRNRVAVAAQPEPTPPEAGPQ